MKPGMIVGERYRIERKLGQGGMSAVYVATDTKFDQPCAVKIAWPHGLSADDFRARFRREAMIGRLLGQVGHGFVRIVDWGDWQADALFLVMDLVEDATDLDLVTGSRPERLERWARAARLVRDAHGKGVIHRDLKPANFLLQPKDGAVFLTDFGLAKQLGVPGADQDDESQHPAMGHLTQSGLTMGTPWYMAPEQFDAKHADERADVYSLGVMLFQALTGELPFKCGLSELASRHEAMRNGLLPIPSPRKLDPSVPEVLDSITTRTLAMEPEKRTPTAQALLEVIEPWLRGQRGTAKHARPLAARASGKHAAQPAPRPAPIAAGVQTKAEAATMPIDVVVAELVHPVEPGPPDPGPPAPPGLRRLEGKAAAYLSEKDGTVLVWVPPGKFFPRLRTAEDGDDTLAQVDMPGLFVGRVPVTWGQWGRWCMATGRPAPKPALPVDDDHPVHGVTWEDARAYCAWAGGRLPTEAEWERAASGDEERLYPWGNEPPSPARANYAQGEGSQQRTTPVGRYLAGASPFGLLDMAGNVLEWIDDARPKAATRSLRGGSWRLDASFLVVRRKHLLPATARESHVGFRMVRDGPGEGSAADAAQSAKLAGPGRTVVEPSEPSIARSSPPPADPAPIPPTRQSVPQPVVQAAPKPRPADPVRRGASGRVPARAPVTPDETDPRPVGPRASGKRSALPAASALLDQVLALLPAQAREPARRGDEIKFFWGDQRVPLSILPGEGPGPAHLLLEQRVKLDRAALRGPPTGLDNLLRAANGIACARLGLRLVVSEDRLRYRREVVVRGASVATPFESVLEGDGPPLDREDLAAHLARLVAGWGLAAEPVKRVLKGEPWTRALGDLVDGAPPPDAGRVADHARMLLPSSWRQRPRDGGIDVWPDDVPEDSPPLELAWRDELEASVLVRPQVTPADGVRAWTEGAPAPMVDATLRALNDRHGARPWTLALEAGRGVVARLLLGTRVARPERLRVALTAFHAAVLRDALPPT